MIKSWLRGVNMITMRHKHYALSVFLLLNANMCVAEMTEQTNSKLPEKLFTLGKMTNEHIDPIEVDASLTLTDLITLTLEKYPDRLINEALVAEADALKVRSDSWLAGSTQFVATYNDDSLANNRGYNQSEVTLEFTPWDWGQSAAAELVAQEAHYSADKQSTALKLEVSRLVRESLWDMALAEIRLQQSQYSLDVSKQLLEKVRRRVELGDLARADLLLAESEHLQERSLFAQAEAELMHTRKFYQNLTRTQRMPAHFQETQSVIEHVPFDHPLLVAINAIIARKQATIEWSKTTDTINQPKINIGANITHDPYGTGNTQTTGIGVVIPFGHRTYDAPEIAAAHLELNKVLAQREHLMRVLEKNLHEAEHVLELTRHELEISKQLKDIAEAHLKMTETSFAAGEVNLLDLLKIQARSLQAIRYAKEQEVNLQRNIALYNQAVGVMP